MSTHQGQASRLQNIVSHYRDQLAHHEAQAVQTLEQTYAHVLSLILPQLEQLYQEIASRQDAGEDVPISWLYEHNRLEKLKQFIATQMNRYGATAQHLVEQVRQQGVMLGQQSALALLQGTLPPGITWHFGIPSADAIANLIGATQAGSPLADLFHGFGQEAAKKASEALLAGLALGHNPRQIAPQVKQALDVPRWRALTIARTEQLRSYRSAAQETYRANSNVVEGWIWTAALNARTCAACIASNGTEHPLDEEMAAHVNCRCAAIPKTRSWSDILDPLGIDASGIPETTAQVQSGPEWFDAQSEKTQRAILGSAYDLYASGDVSLEDFVGKNHDPDWGTSIRVKSMKELVRK